MLSRLLYLFANRTLLLFKQRCVGRPKSIPQSQLKLSVTPVIMSWDACVLPCWIQRREEMAEREKREAEAAEKAKQQLANIGFDSGDSAKGAKLFQVSCDRPASQGDISRTGQYTDIASRLVALSATPLRLTVATRSAPTCTVSSAARPVSPRATPTPTPTSRLVSPGMRTLWYAPLTKSHIV